MSCFFLVTLDMNIIVIFLIIVINALFPRLYIVRKMYSLMLINQVYICCQVGLFKAYLSVPDLFKF